MSIWDALIILSFIVYSLYSGFANRKQASQNLEEYFLAGRSLKGWQAGLSMAATQFASDTPLLITGLIATAGIFSLWQMWIYAISFLFMGFVLAPLWRHARILTDAELTEIRYGEKAAIALRFIKAFYFGTLFNCIVLAWVFFASARIAEPFLLWNQWLPSGLFEFLQSIVTSIGVPFVADPAASAEQLWILSTNNVISVFAIVFLTFLYSSTGGLRAVVATDIFQLGIMLVATLLYGYFIVDHVGGFSALYEGLQSKLSGDSTIGLHQMLAFDPSQAKEATWAVLSVFALQWLLQLNSDGTGYLAQRSMACASDRDAKIASLVFTFVQVLLRSLLWLPLALGLFLIYDAPAGIGVEAVRSFREFTYVLGMSEFLPVGVKGILLTAMLAALASTVDTHLNWGSSYWTNDLYKRGICELLLKRKPKDKELVWVARISNLIILMISMFVATKLDSIQKTWKISLLLGSGVGVVLILRWLWWRMTAWAEIGALISSGVLAVILPSLFDTYFIQLLLCGLGSTAVAVAICYLVGPESQETLQSFYNRIQPPGFWGPYGKNSESQLWRKVGAVAAFSFSIFCLLVGIGSWLIHSPSPTWFPLRGLYIALLLLMGLALLPVGYRLGFKDK